MIGRVAFLLSLLCVAQALPLSLNGASQLTRSKRNANREHIRNDIADKEVRTIISAIVDAILDGDRKKRSEIPEEEDEAENNDSTFPTEESSDNLSGQSALDSSSTKNVTSIVVSQESSGSGESEEGSAHLKSTVKHLSDSKVKHLDSDIESGESEDSVSGSEQENSSANAFESTLSAESGTGSGDKTSISRSKSSSIKTLNFFNKKTVEKVDDSEISESGNSGAGHESGSGNIDEISSMSDENDDVIEDSAGFIEEPKEVEHKEKINFDRTKRDEEGLERDDKLIEQYKRTVADSYNNNVTATQNLTSNNVTNNISSQVDNVEVEQSGSGSGQESGDSSDIDSPIESVEKNTRSVSETELVLNNITTSNLTDNKNHATVNNSSVFNTEQTPSKYLVANTENSSLNAEEAVQNSSVLNTEEAVQNSSLNTEEAVQNSSVLNTEEAVQNSSLNTEEAVQNSSLNTEEAVQNSSLNTEEAVQNSTLNTEEAVQTNTASNTEDENIMEVESGDRASETTQSYSNITLNQSQSNSYVKRDKIVSDLDVENDNSYLINSDDAESNSGNESGVGETSANDKKVSSPLYEQISNLLKNTSETKESTGDALMDNETYSSGSGSPWDGSSGYGLGSAGGKRAIVTSGSGASPVNTSTNKSNSYINDISNDDPIDESSSGNKKNKNSEEKTPHKENQNVTHSFHSIQSNYIKKSQGEPQNGIGSGVASGSYTKNSRDKPQDEIQSEVTSGSGSGSENNDADVKNEPMESGFDMNNVQVQSGSGSSSGYENNSEESGEDGVEEEEQSIESSGENDPIDQEESDDTITSGSDVADSKYENYNNNSETPNINLQSKNYYDPLKNLTSFQVNNTNINAITDNNKNKTDTLNIDNSSTNVKALNQYNESNYDSSVSNQTSEDADDDNGSTNEGSADDENKESGGEVDKKRGKLIEEIVTDMAKAAIESVEVDDSNMVVKKSVIVTPDELNFDERLQRSAILEHEAFVTPAKANQEMDVALKDLVRSILKEDLSVRKNIEQLSSQRKEDEEKLVQEVISFVKSEPNKSTQQAKSKVISGIKDFEGYVQALSQTDSLTPFKHNLIAKKLEKDLLDHLSIPEQNSQIHNIVVKEEKLLHDSELEFIKDKISAAEKNTETYAAKHADNMEDIRKHAIALLNPIIDSLPLKKEDIAGLAKSISRSAWVKMVTHIKKDDRASRKVRRNLNELLNLS